MDFVVNEKKGENDMVCMNVKDKYPPIQFQKNVYIQNNTGLAKYVRERL